MNSVLYAEERISIESVRAFLASCGHATPSRVAFSVQNVLQAQTKVKIGQSWVAGYAETVNETGMRDSKRQTR